MNARNEEQELQRFLEELRRAEEASAPEFHSVLARVHASQAAPRSSAWRLAAVGAALVVIAAGLFLLARRPPPEVDVQAAWTLAEWKAPTDFLLRTPGSELLDSTPRLVQVPDYSALDADEMRREATPKSEARKQSSS